MSTHNPIHTLYIPYIYTGPDRPQVAPQTGRPRAPALSHPQHRRGRGSKLRPYEED